MWRPKLEGALARISWGMPGCPVESKLAAAAAGLPMPPCSAADALAHFAVREDERGRGGKWEKRACAEAPGMGAENGWEGRGSQKRGG